MASKLILTDVPFTLKDIQLGNLITGFCTLRDAKLGQRGEATSQAIFQADIPVGQAMGGVAPGGVADVGFKGSYTSKEEHEDTAEMEGERIYAFCYRRVRRSWHERKSVDNMSLQSRNIWRTFSDTRTDDEDGKFLRGQHRESRRRVTGRHTRNKVTSHGGR